MLKWFQSLIYGLLCGFTEFLPVSSQPHSVLLDKLFGITDMAGVLSVSVHLGALLSLLLICRPQIARLSREQRIASLPHKRRKRQPDPVALMDIKLLKTVAVPMLLGFLAYPWVGDQGSRLWILGLALVFNGIMIYLPQFMARANKDARHLSGKDGVLIGLAGALSVIPGISRVGMLLSASSMRGTDRQYGLQIALLLSIPALAVQLLIDCIVAFASVSGVTFLLIICAVTAFASAAVSSYFSMIFIRFLSVNAGFSGFAYYSWGTAMLAFILYLVI